MDTKILEDELALEIHIAEFLCRAKHGCRNGADCKKCELLALNCKNTYIARHLMEHFNILSKEDA